MRCLYLDFDGVLHPDAAYAVPGKGIVLRGHPGHRLFEHIPLLESILAPYPTVHIVLSTSWVPELGYSRARKRLGPMLAERVVGATFHSRFMRRARDIEPRGWDGSVLSLQEDSPTLARGRQVVNDVRRRRPADWIALDDCDEGWDGYGDHLVLTDCVRGLADPVAIEALQCHLARRGDSRMD